MKDGFHFELVISAQPMRATWPAGAFGARCGPWRRRGGRGGRVPCFLRSLRGARTGWFVRHRSPSRIRPGFSATGPFGKRTLIAPEGDRDA